MMRSRSRWLRPLAIAAALTATAIALAACSGVGILNALVRGDTFTLQHGLAYGPLPRQRLDVYTPASPPPATGHPVVVFFYGGSWTGGDRADYRFVGEALAGRGALTIVADYRVYPEVRYPEFLKDSALAVAWALENAKRLGGDPARVIVMGHSAGGYNAAMVALDPRWLAPTGHRPQELAAWIGLAGAYEFIPLAEGSPARPVFFHPNYPDGSQPIDHAGRNSPPAFLAAPARDRVVSVERSTLAMARRLQAAGVPVELKIYDGVTHSLLAGVFARPLRGLAPVLEDTAAFIAAVPRR